MQSNIQVIRTASFALLIMFGATIVTALAGNSAGADETLISHNIKDYVATKLDDFVAVMHVDQYDEHAGTKISSSFGFAYKLKGDVKISYKEENKLRIEAQVGSSKVILINNGTTQYAQGLGIHKKDNLGNTPGKRKTLLDAGMIANGYLNYTEAEFKRTQMIDGVTYAVFRISYKDKEADTSHRLIWVDPKTKITLKREEYSQIGKLNATYFYRSPKEIVPGIWFPTKVEVFNRDNEKAGITSYREIKVNQGLTEGVFKL